MKYIFVIWTGVIKEFYNLSFLRGYSHEVYILVCVRAYSMNSIIDYS